MRPFRWQRFAKALHERPMTVEQLAERFATTPANVKNALSQHGLSRLLLPKRGFVIPLERRDEYRELRKLGLTPREAGECMGLVGRAPARGRSGGVNGRGNAKFKPALAAPPIDDP